jgi:hypothetical protein
VALEKMWLNCVFTKGRVGGFFAEIQEIGLEKIAIYNVHFSRWGIGGVANKEEQGKGYSEEK